MNRKLRMGMVGGGKDAFIGAVHRSAAALDGQAELVCGAFSSNPEKSKASGKELYLPDDRVYGSFEEMIDKEKDLPEGERMDFVSIVTPNHMHFPPAKMALENGFHVVCDKPMTYNLEQAKELEKLVEKTGLLFALTHNYTGYPMVKQARDMVKEGKLGKIRKIVVEYPQGWLASPIEASGQKQASWRVDPAKAGIASCMGDIGTHAENLSEFITGIKISQMCADLHTFVEGRTLEDDGNILLKFDSGASGVLHASQISVGEENNLIIRVYGETAGLEWHQQDPNTLTVKYNDRPMEVYRTGAGFDFLSENALAHTRVPAGHPEGFIEAFANIYRNFALTLGAHLEGKKPDPKFSDFPTVHDGVRGMAFLETVVESNKSDKKWTGFKS
ncbi:MAG: Gfo/Idh/MocA family oxidoreductase [Bacteroidales bacterium]